MATMGLPIIVMMMLLLNPLKDIGSIRILQPLLLLLWSLSLSCENALCGRGDTVVASMTTL